MDYQQTKELLSEKGQLQLLEQFDALSEEGKAELLRQIEKIDWTVLNSPSAPHAGETEPLTGLSLREIEKNREEYSALGAKLIREGALGAVLLAGGQGTRLGSDAPKGAFNIGITRPLYIFECLIQNLLNILKPIGAFVPLYIMTSEKNDEETRAFLSSHAYFGYPEEYVTFFVQDMAPATDFGGKVLLEAQDRLALSPNGNGGWFSSLLRAGHVARMRERGVKWLNVCAVDNVLQRIADPVFLGATAMAGAPCGAKTVKKRNPEERVGVLCKRGGLPDVIEYYELDEATANLRDGAGNLLYADGVILNYLFQVSRLEEIAAAKIPVHRVKKKVPYFDGTRTVTPASENAYKYETLILDMIRLTGDCLSFEVEREREFAPIKNATGTDSVETARALLQKNGVKL